MSLTLRNLKGNRLTIAELDNNFIYLDSRDIFSGSTSNTILTLQRNDGSTIDVDLSSLIDAGDTYITGATITGDDLILSRNDGNTISVNLTGSTTIQNLITDVTNIGSVVYGANQLLSGGAIYLSGLTYDITPLTYTIDGVYYSTSANTQVTVNSGDTLYDRIDLIIVDISGNTSILTGDPSINPVSPDVDESTQIVVALINVPAGATSTLLSETLVYGDNLGQPTEWATSITDDPGVTIDLNYSGITYGGSSKSIKYENSQNLAAVHFDVSGGTFDTTVQNRIQFAIYNTQAWTSNVRLTLRLKTAGNTQIGNLVQVYNGKYGFNSNLINQWQIIQVPVAHFNPTTNFIGRIKFETYKNPGTGLYMIVDNIRMVPGVYMPSTPKAWWYVKGDTATTSIPTTPQSTLRLEGGNNINTYAFGTNRVSFNLNTTLTGLTQVNATTFYGDGSNLSGITNTYVTGTTFNQGNYDLTLYRNDGGTVVTNLGILAGDMFVTGGTYDIGTGVVTFTNNSGGTFQVTGFVSGMTDSYTTSAYLVGNEIRFDNNIQGTNFYNVNLTPILSGFTSTSYWTSGSTGISSVRVINGSGTDATGTYALASGRNTTASGNESNAEGYLTVASGDQSHAEGYQTTASGNRSHAEGETTVASGHYSHAEGSLTNAVGVYSHAEGRNTNASGQHSHAEGYLSVASGLTSHAEGHNTLSLGQSSHAEGRDTKANGDYSHAEGRDTIANGFYSHAGGHGSIANNSYTFVHGLNSLASANSVNVFGANITGTTANTTYVDKFNIKTVGVGTPINNLGIDSSGNVVVGITGGTGGGDTYWSAGTGTNSLLTINQNHTNSGAYSIIGGGSGHTISSTNSVIMGGDNHIVSGYAYGSAIIGGGTYYGDVTYRNSITNSPNSFIGGGYKNNINTTTSTSSFIGGGKENNIEAGFASIIGGSYNINKGTNSIIGGGQTNYINGSSMSFIGGGDSNTLTAQKSFIGGGRANSATTGTYISIVGGVGNIASGDNSFIGGGINGIASGKHSFIGGGINATAYGYYSSTIGGYGNIAYQQMSSVVGGRNNSTSGGGSSSFIGGGQDNVASNNRTVIVGCVNGLASNQNAAIIGGGNSTASGSYSFVAGGRYNTASQVFSSVVGGQYNTSTNQNSSVVGGVGNIASGNGSFIGGGGFYSTYTTYGSTASGENSGIVGGGYSVASGKNSFIGGGYKINIGGAYSSSLGGYNNSLNTFASSSSIIGGQGNNLTGNTSTLLGGSTNILNSSNASIIGGNANKNYGPQSIVGGGVSNEISIAGENSMIAGGASNRITNSLSFAGGGLGNLASAIYSSVVGGASNSATTIASSVIGGVNNIISGQRSVIIGGQNISGTTDDTVYVPKLNIGTLGTGTSINNLGIDSNGFVVTGTTGGGTSKYSASVPMTGATIETVTHNLGTTDIIVQIKDSTGKLIIPDVVDNYTINTVDITVSSTETYRVIIIG